jgi:hypothetical protein
MDLIKEFLLVDFVTHRIMTAVTIVETKAGRFTLTVYVSWKDDAYQLANARHQPRTWANLNTLIRFLKPLHLSKVPMTLVLDEDTG